MRSQTVLRPDDFRVELNQAAEMTVVRPGDTLVVRVASELSHEHAVTLRDMIKAKMPGVDVLVVAGAEQIVVYRPSEEPWGDGHV